MSALTATDLRDAAFYLHMHARMLKESNVNCDGEWAYGDGPYDTRKEWADQMRDEYEHKLELARKLYRMARSVPVDRRDRELLALQLPSALPTQNVIGIGDGK